MNKKRLGDIKIIFYIFLIFIVVFVITMRAQEIFNKKSVQEVKTPPKSKYWEIRSIDTMKISRDFAREKLYDELFDIQINKHTENIAKTGTNYIAIATPYDEEFRPILYRWVKAARKHKLKVWFRGNFSGWEGWFDYPRIDGATHIDSVKRFILENRELFVDGDIFSPCPECENGTKIDLGNKENLDNYRNFLIEEFNVSKDAFSQIGKNVESGYFSMNGDLARVLMDSNTTRALGGIVVIDHYVKEPETLARDIRDLADQSGGYIMLGEFGAPIPDIHGVMTEEQQADWIDRALKEISEIDELIGINYWVDTDGSTALWRVDGTEKPGVKILRKYFNIFK